MPLFNVDLSSDWLHENGPFTWRLHSTFDPSIFYLSEELFKVFFVGLQGFAYLLPSTYLLPIYYLYRFGQWPKWLYVDGTICHTENISLIV